MSGGRPISAELTAIAKRMLALAGEYRLGIITGESCTSGLLTTALSGAPGAAELLHGGFVTYTKENKTAALGVPADLLRHARRGVSGGGGRDGGGGACALTRRRRDCHHGVAGPAKDEDGNPVGLVYIAVARTSFPSSVVERNYGDVGRDAVREHAMIDALLELGRLLERRL
jgi:nicotinamide-nucleotide amidase